MVRAIWFLVADQLRLYGSIQTTWLRFELFALCSTEGADIDKKQLKLKNIQLIDLTKTFGLAEQTLTERP